MFTVLFFVERKSICQSDVLLGATQQNGIIRLTHISYFHAFQTSRMHL